MSEKNISAQDDFKASSTNTVLADRLLDFAETGDVPLRLELGTKKGAADIERAQMRVCLREVGRELRAMKDSDPQSYANLNKVLSRTPALTAVIDEFAEKYPKILQGNMQAIADSTNLHKTLNTLYAQTPSNLPFPIELTSMAEQLKRPIPRPSTL